MDESILIIRLFFRILELSFASKLDWGSHVVSIAKSGYKNWRDLADSFNKVCSSEVVLYLNLKQIIFIPLVVIQ